MTMRSEALAVLGLTVWLCGCFEGANGARDVRFGGNRGGEPLSQAELQQDIQRFTTQFTDSVAQASEPLIAVRDPHVRETAMARVLLYQSSALDIASGPLPEVNVLDMLVFLALNRRALEHYWNPKVFGEHGAELEATFEESERDMSPIADKLLSPQQRADLNALVETWERAHPNQHRVEGVRFMEFGALAGKVSAEQAARAKGLLAQVKSATQAANQAVLLGDRALFLSQRMPFLVRAQARLGVQQSLSDTFDRVTEVQGLFDEMPEARGLVEDLTHLSASARQTTRDARLLLAEAKPILEDVGELGKRDEAAAKRGASVQQTLATGERLTDKTLKLLRELRALVPDHPGRELDVLKQQIDGIALRCIGYLILLAAACAALFWGGYFLAKRGLRSSS